MGIVSGQHQTPQEFTNQSDRNTKCHVNSSLGSSSIKKNWRCISLCGWYILKLARSSCCKHRPELCDAFRRLSWDQPRVAEALRSGGPPLRMIIQHTKEEVGEFRSFHQQEVVFLHQNVIQAPEPQWTDSTQVTWMWNPQYYTRCSQVAVIEWYTGKFQTCLCGWSTPQRIYPTRRQLVGLYQAAL